MKGHGQIHMCLPQAALSIQICSVMFVCKEPMEMYHERFYQGIHKRNRCNIIDNGRLHPPAPDV